MDINYCKNIMNTFIKIRNGNINRSELADELGVSPRTISDYICYLKEQLNVDIQYDKKLKAYIMNDAGEFDKIINKEQLKGYHIWIILLILLRTQYIFPSKIKFIEKELLNFAAESEKFKLNRLFNFDIDETSQKSENYREDLLKNIYDSFMQNKKIKIRYKPQNRDAQTYTLLPINITFNNGHIYLIAYNEKHETRNFRLDRIKNITILEETYKDEEAEFNLTDYLNKSVHMYGGLEEIKIKVKVSKSHSDILEEKFPFNSEKLSSDNESETYVITAYNTDGVLIDLLGQLKDQFEIIEPVELRRKVCDIAQGILRRNEE